MNVGEVRFVNELPRISTGKVDRRALREIPVSCAASSNAIWVDNDSIP